MIDEDVEQAIAEATVVLDEFMNRFRKYWTADMAAKIGLPGREDEPAVAALASDLMQILARTEPDHTQMFRSLSGLLRNGDATNFVLATDEDWDGWHQRWLEALGEADLDEVAAAMDQVNPVYIPRNHLVEEALAAANAGDMEPFNQLLDVTTSPFVAREGLNRYAEPASADFTNGYQTFCGT